jgi:hypothetical protein
VPGLPGAALPTTRPPTTRCPNAVTGAATDPVSATAAARVTDSAAVTATLRSAAIRVRPCLQREYASPLTYKVFPRTTDRGCRLADELDHGAAA